MTQPDWSKAPKGATHWGPANEHFCQRWYRKHRGEWWCHYASVDDWYLVSMDRTRHDQLIPRPAKPRWRYHWGGPCPVDRGPALLFYRNGDVLRELYPETLGWSHPWKEGQDRRYDIIAYLVD